MSVETCFTSPPTSARVGVSVSGALAPITGVELLAATWKLTRVRSVSPSFEEVNSAIQSPASPNVVVTS